jgi:hypothetical protein
MRHAFDVVGLEAKVKTILAAHPTLSMHGVAVVGEGILPVIDIEGQRKVEREALLSLDSLRAILVAMGWIQRYLVKDTQINRQRTSYGLKHVAERWTGYLTTGQFTVAMLVLGFRLEWAGNDVLFNVKEGSVRQAENAQ